MQDIHLYCEKLLCVNRIYWDAMSMLRIQERHVQSHNTTKSEYSSHYSEDISFIRRVECLNFKSTAQWILILIVVTFSAFLRIFSNFKCGFLLSVLTPRDRVMSLVPSPNKVPYTILILSFFERSIWRDDFWWAHTPLMRFFVDRGIKRFCNCAIVYYTFIFYFAILVLLMQALYKSRVFIRQWFCNRTYLLNQQW